MCPHYPHCPTVEASDRDASKTVMRDDVTGWSLLCNGLVLFDDTGEILPDGQVVAPHRGEPASVQVAV